MFRRHIQSNFRASRFRAVAKMIKSPMFFVTPTPSTSSLGRDFSSSTPILLQQQQRQQAAKFIKLPSVDDALFIGELRVIYKLAKFLSGLDEIPGGYGIPAGLASPELLALTERLGQIVLTFANIPLDDENNNNPPPSGLQKTFRCALALAAFIFDRASIISGSEVEFADVDVAIKSAMPTKKIGVALQLDIGKHVYPILRCSAATLSLELLQNQQQHQIQDDEAKTFVKLVLASTRMNIDAAFHKVKFEMAQIAAEKGYAPTEKPRSTHSSPVANGRDYVQDIIETPNFDITTGVTPIRGFRGGLRSVFKKKYDTENEFQTALLNWFTDSNKKPKIFGVAPKQFVVGRSALPDDFSGKNLKPDVTVFLLEHQNPLGRVLFLELKVGEISTLATEDDVNQLFAYLSARLVENPFRPFVFGILTNGTSVQMFRAHAETPGSHRKVFERFVNECDQASDAKTEASREKLLDCLEFLLTRTPDELGFVSHPTFNVDSTSGEVTMVDGNSSQLGAYALGALLGTGESCRVYACVPTEQAKRGIFANDKTTFADSFVAKIYRSKEAAQHEKSMFDVVAAAKVQNTTTMVGCDMDQRVIFVKPECVHFRRPIVYHDFSEVAPKEISASHAKCLIETLQALHRAGIVHCDIQPQNLFCVASDPDKAILNDFGRSYLRANLSFSEFRALIEHDYERLAFAIKDLVGGEKAWEEAMSTKEGRLVKVC